MKVIRFQDLIAQGKVAGKRVFIRSDLNVPLNENGTIADDSRIRESLECIRMALDVSAAIMVTSHLGRPREGSPTPRDSLAPVAARLADLLKENIRLDSGWTNGVKVAPGEIVLLENCRLNPGEKADDPKLAKKMAKLCDVYVNDAFGAAHRAEATTHGIVEFVDLACAGPLMVNEILAAEKIVSASERPVIAIVGGSKVSTKLEVLEHLAETVDLLIVGGGIANTFMLAAGLPVGRSLVETSLVDKAKNIMNIMKERGARVPVPVDVVTAKMLSADAPVTLKDVADVAEDDMILDIGPRSAANLVRFMEKAKTILWNGPLGVFEIPSCAHGTQAVADAIAESPAYSIAGGGDTLAAIAKFGLADKIDYISTGGGAFLEMLAGKKLPAIEALERRSML